MLNLPGFLRVRADFFIFAESNNNITNNYKLMFIPCMCCGRQFPETWTWWVCDKCGYRVCPSCFPSYKCPKCTWGRMNKTK